MEWKSSILMYLLACLRNFIPNNLWGLNLFKQGGVSSPLWVSFSLNPNHFFLPSVQFGSVIQSCPTLLWTVAHQASLFITNSQSLVKLMSIESVMSSNHLILCRPLLLLPSIFPSIRVFSNESALCIRWPKYWSFIPKPTPTYSSKGLHRTSSALQRTLEIQHQNNSHHNEVGSIPKI